MLYSSDILRQRITIKETGFAGIRFLRENNVKSSQCCLVLNLLQESVERNILEVSPRPPVQFLHALLPAIILTNDDRANAMFDTMSHNELANMVEVVFQTEVAFLAFTLGLEPVEMLVDALANATVDQYGSRLIGSYRSKIVQANVNTGNTFCRGFMWDVLFVLHVHNEAESLGCNDYLLVVSVTLNAEAVVTRRDGCEFLVLLGLSSFDGFVVEDNLSQFVLVVGRHRHFDKLAWVFLPCVECLLEVRPIGQALTDGLLGGLCVVQIAETVLVLDGRNEHVDVG